MRDERTRYRVRVIIEKREPFAKRFRKMLETARYQTEWEHVHSAAVLAADAIALYEQEEGR